MTTVTAQRQGPVLILTLNGPAIRNAIGPEVYTAITAALTNPDPALRAVVLTGAGGYFCAGGNIQSLKASAQGTMAQATARTDLLNTMIRAITDCPLPVIAAIEGGAAGVGLALALACDLMVSADTAKFTLSYVKIGLSPDGGVTHFLRAALPRQMVMDMALRAQPVTAETFHRFGLIAQLTAPDMALPVALQIAQTLAAGPRTAQARIKHQVNSAGQNDLATQQALEAHDMNTARFGPEAAEGLCAFLDKRAPDFTKP
ncbi:oxepin-CoA hydrolase, alternative type [Pararhodobacter sp.]|uniref:oxepin-CoA hydrolase, alternative type n=1 Tax=Pararhodobacter sp. TaxID=2127056 RepID=UPI002AFDDA49|nr:enoyl-CoA hydratase family protein [Pararhodobacter sp.]